jgi:TonB family protein
MSSFTTSFVSCVASYAVNSAWQVPLAAGAGWAASRLLAKVGPRAQHRAWVASLVLAVLLPACSLLPRPAFVLSARASSGHAALLALGAGSALPAPAGLRLVPYTVLVALFLVYGCALLYFLARFLWSLYATSALLRSGCPVLLDARAESLWRRSREALAVTHAALLSTPHVSGPVTAGVRSPAVLVPLDFLEECSSDQLLVAMGHECAHIRRLDFLKNLLYQAAGTLIAYHPAAWFLQSQIAQSRELICDSLAASLLSDGQQYAQSLLSLAAIIITRSPHSTSYAIGTFDAGILEKRVMSIQVKPHTVSLRARYALTVAVALLFVTAAVAGASSAMVVETQPGAVTANGAYGPVYSLGGDVTNPKLTYSRNPEFPKGFHAKSKTFQGICVLKMTVTREGTPADIRVVRSLGPQFDESAVTAVKQYRFKPATRFGKPVAVAVSLEVNFQLF